MWEQYQELAVAAIQDLAEEFTDAFPGVKCRTDDMTWQDVPVSAGLEIFLSAPGSVITIGLQITVTAPSDEAALLSAASVAVAFTYHMRLLHTEDEADELAETRTRTIPSAERVGDEELTKFILALPEFVDRRRATLEEWMSKL